MYKRLVRLAPLALLVSGLCAADARAEAPSTQLIQPGQGERGLVLAHRVGRAGRPGRAWVDTADGDRTPIHLRRGESLTTIAETRSGFVVAGARETREGTLELVMMEERSGKVSRLDSPAGRKPLLQVRPTLMTADRDFTGAAWLEGDGIRSLSVRVADWTGVDWGPTEAVSSPGRGSQTGLAGAVMDDGTWLLVWSAYDGRDDEIVWSSRGSDSWSKPSRLTANKVPDVTPALHRDGEGVVMAWAQMHRKSYRLMTARFSPGSGWSSARAVTGPAGHFPEFVTLEDRTFLVWRSGWPMAWAVAEVGETGGVSKHALVHEPSQLRPALLLAGRDEVRLRWSTPDREEAALWEIRP